MFGHYIENKQNRKEWVHIQESAIYYKGDANFAISIRYNLEELYSYIPM